MNPNRSSRAPAPGENPTHPVLEQSAPRSLPNQYAELKRLIKQRGLLDQHSAYYTGKTVFTLGLLFPLTVAIIPLFLMIRDLNLTNSFWGVALPQAAFSLPMTVVILRPFLMALPQELEEAAMLDGTSRIGFFWRILLPLSGPGLVTVGVLAFVASWNSYLLPLLILSDPATQTLPLGSTQSARTSPGSNRRSTWSVAQLTLATVGIPRRW